MPGQHGIANLSAMRGRRKGGTRAPQITTSEGIAALADAFLSHLSARAYSQPSIAAHDWALRQFTSWVDTHHQREPSSFIRSDIEAYQLFLHHYRNPRDGKPLVTNTQLARLGCVRRFFAWLCRSGTIPANPAADLDLPRKQTVQLPKTLNEQEIQFLLAIPNPADPFGLRDRCILELFYATGIRRTEMTNLDHGDYDAHTRTLLVRKGKGGKSRMLPVGERAAAWLDRYLAQSRPLFDHLPNETAFFLSGYGTRFSPAYLGNWIKKLMKRCGIDKQGSCHLWRHSCATDMHRGGADIRYVQEMLGHARMETTQIYTHVHIDALRDVHTRCHPHGRLDETHDIYGQITKTATPEIQDLPSRDVEEALQVEANMAATASYPIARAALATVADQVGPELPPDEEPPSGGTAVTSPKPPPKGSPPATSRPVSGAKNRQKPTKSRGLRPSVTDYQYDSNNNLTRLTYPPDATHPAGKQVNYTYNARNLLATVTDWSNRVTTYQYDRLGRLTGTTRPNGTSNQIAHDTANQLISIKESAGGKLFSYLNFTHDAAGQVKSRFQAPLVTQPWQHPTFAATYDDDNRLASVNGATVTHDADGNMTYGPIRPDSGNINLTYNSRNQLTNAAGISYTYDSEGRRRTLTDSSGEIRDVIEASGKLLIRHHPDTTKTYYVYGLGLLYEANESDATKTYHFDQVGSTIVRTNDAGSVIGRAAYSAYGLITHKDGDMATSFLYNGQAGVQTDPNGLLNMRARYYSPYLMRFLNADPSGFSGGSNWFSYADGNPISLNDPFGLCPSNYVSPYDPDGSLNWTGIGEYILGGLKGVPDYIAENGWTSVKRNLSDQQFVAISALSGMGMGGITGGFSRAADEIAITAEGIATPHGLALQADSAAARAALGEVQSGATVYRQGSFGVQNTADAQFWSLQNPAGTQGFANKMGMPGGSGSPDWIMGGTISPGSPVITRPAPGIGTNMGGNMEAVVPQNGVSNLWFHMPD